MKMHLNLATHDLDASVAFYRTLLVTEPLKYRTDYALFVTERPGLELALDVENDPAFVRDGTRGEHAHYGIAVETAADVDAAIERLRAAAIPVEIESDETCCYALQTKVWATDPDGRRWETYVVIAETEERDGARDACCP